MAPSPSALSGSIKVVLSNTGPQGPPGAGAAFFRAQALVDAPSIAWDASHGAIASLTLAGDHELATPSNLIPGPYTLIVTQGAPGGFDLGYSTAFEFNDGVPPILSQAEGAVSILTFVCDGTALINTGSQLNVEPALAANYYITEGGDRYITESGQFYITEN